MSAPGGLELVLVFLVILLVFGASRLPKLARSMGQAGKEFKAGMKEGYVAQPVEGPCPFCSVEVAPDSKFCPGCAKSAADIVAARDAKVAKA